MCLLVVIYVIRLIEWRSVLFRKRNKKLPVCYVAQYFYTSWQILGMYNGYPPHIFGIKESSPEANDHMLELYWLLWLLLVLEQLYVIWCETLVLDFE